MDPATAYAESVAALNRNDFHRAFELAMRAREAAPGHGGVHFVAGVAALQLERLPQALALLHRASALSPARPDYHAQRARALSTARLFREAMDAAEEAVRQQPADPLTFDTLGVVFTQANEHRRAADMFRHAAAAAPEVATFRFNLATSLMFLGEIDEAEREYEACLAREPHFWKAHLALSQLRRQTAESNHLLRLNALLSTADGAPDARMYLHLAIAKEEEDLGDYASSYAHLVTGKHAGAAGRRYRFERDRELFDAIVDAFAEPASPSSASTSEEPVFVFGMPRSGTTLVERILSSHPDVHSGGELQNLGVAIKRLSGSRTRELLDPDTVRRARGADLSSLGDLYIASTRPGTGHVPHFVDKLPHNFLYAGFIAAALPNARMICVRRDPMDTCLSNLRQLFALSSPYYDYSFDPIDTARYYVQFDRLMGHWKRILPGRILEIAYEDIVERQADATRRLLDFCGLAWNDACLSFERNAAPVATASVVQVRSPMFRTSLARWKRYGPVLDPMRQVLEEAGIAVDPP
jgi:tetratricopeptide (TPR) repeat protein